MEKGARYWDAFQLRTEETITALKAGKLPPLRRLSLHVTNRCNLACGYCNEKHSPNELPEPLFRKLVKEYSELGGGILHMTGGEPACVPYLFGAMAELGPLYRNVDFHLNTNGLVEIPVNTLKHIKRLKISLDSCDVNYFDELVGVKGAFLKVYSTLSFINILNKHGKGPICSVTYTMTKQNYKDVPAFLEWFHASFPHIYAVFVSAYKGRDPRFEFTNEDTEDLFATVVPRINELCDLYGMEETRWLFASSHSAKTFDASERFPENKVQPCFLQLSELVIDESGRASNCSHLSRDGVAHTEFNISNMSLSEVFTACKKDYDLKPLSDKCLYGCNKRLVRFNTDVSDGLFTQ